MVFFRVAHDAFVFYVCPFVRSSCLLSFVCVAHILRLNAIFQDDQRCSSILWCISLCMYIDMYIFTYIYICICICIYVYTSLYLALSLTPSLNPSHPPSLLWLDRKCSTAVEGPFMCDAGILLHNALANKKLTCICIQPS